MRTYDFEDGHGLVPAHRHENGGGWVADTARVDASAYVGPSARVYGNAQVYGDTRVCGNARVYGNAQVYGDTRVYGNARVYGGARVCGDTSRSPLHLAIGYGVTICDDLITIGCTTDTLHGWRTRQDLSRDPAALAYADLIAALEERHQAI